MNTVRTYLTQMAEMLEKAHAHNKTALTGWRYRSLEAFVIGVGREFEPSPLPKSIRKGRFKECYGDAHKLAIRNPERYVYCEGFASSGIIPVLHAWCFDLKRNVIVDRTWHDNRGQGYFGVPFNLRFVNEVICRTGVYGVLGNLWMLRDEKFNPLVIEPEKYLHPSHQGGK